MSTPPVADILAAPPWTEKKKSKGKLAPLELPVIEAPDGLDFAAGERERWLGYRDDHGELGCYYGECEECRAVPNRLPYDAHVTAAYWRLQIERSGNGVPWALLGYGPRELALEVWSSATDEQLSGYQLSSGANGYWWVSQLLAAAVASTLR